MKDIDNIPENTILVTADVVGLYPNIPHDVGLAALREALDSRESKKIPTEDLVRMAEFVLKNNYFEFNGSIKQQLSGTAIGTKFAPPYACLFMDKLETNFLKTQKLQPLVWLRYIDDVFFLWTHGEEKLTQFLEDLNAFDSNIKFTHEYNRKEIPFLDLKVGIKDGKITTNLYVKDTDRHQYLQYTSAHPHHTKRSVVFSQTLRISRLCTFERDFKSHKAEMRQWFAKRDYPQDVIDSEMNKVKFSFIDSNNRNRTNRKGIPFVVTFHPLLKCLGNILHKNFYLLQMNEEVKKVFSLRPMVSFRSARKLSSYLVRAKLYPLDRKVGSSKCNCKRCQVCNNISETNTFTCSNDGTSYKINHRFDCNEKCLIYLLTCKKCYKQYVGQTVDTFRSRWNNYRDNARKYERGQHCMQRHLFEHFNLPGHSGFLEDVIITLIDKTDPTCPTKREDYWIHTLNTKAPMGLNVEDGF